MNTVSMAEEVQRRRRGDNRIATISRLYREAEVRLKQAEQQGYELGIPTLNELRYAGHHVVNALNAIESAAIDFELHEAESHCRRGNF